MPNDLPDWTSVVARPQTQLAGSPWVYPSGDHTKTFTLAADTSIVCVLLPAFSTVTQLFIRGVTSGFTYLKAAPFNTSFHPYYTAVINSAVDSQVTVEINGTPGNTAYISSIPDPVAQITLPNQPAPWEAPTMTPAPIDFANPGPGNTVTVIAAPNNAQSIWLHGMQWVYTGATAGTDGQWQDSNGTEISADSVTLNSGPRFHDFKGAKMAGGFAFQYKQIGAAAAGTYNIRGNVCYSVY